MKITTEELDKITQFIGEESYKLKQDLPYHNQEKIIVLIPDWLLNTFRFYFKTISNTSSFEKLSEPFFYGNKVQSHYKDEVVVFYKDYYLNREKFKPKIYTINT